MSSEEEDTQALCEMRGVGRNAPLPLQLKAIDEEYHYLLEQGQSDKADYVQKLYALKSKQVSKVRIWFSTYFPLFYCGGNFLGAVTFRALALLCNCGRKNDCCCCCC